jgi:putative transposase
MKGTTSRKLLQENKELSKIFGTTSMGRYFVASSGNVTDEIILEYIKIRIWKNICELIIHY